MKRLIVCMVLAMGTLAYGQTWLSLPAATGYVDIGDLDISGTALTVEALYTSTDPSSVDLVSKHSSPANVNYLLRSTHAELTTTGGFLSTPSACPPDQFTCRHAAMVYDGTTLSFYLNGQLNGQLPMNGTLAQNNFEALIGNYGCCFAGEQWFGFIDEVRIWNVARTQAQIQAFMFSSLPSPTTQFGLQAYYSFSTSLNLQGNFAWDGFVAGTASIGANNPFCAGLSTLCIVLAQEFERFTWTQAGDGLQLDWVWNGNPPQSFAVEAGATTDAMQSLVTLPGDAAHYRLLDRPRAVTWYRIAALSANGEVRRSNFVQYVPPTGAQEFQLITFYDHVGVQMPATTAATWRVTDIAGKLISQGQSASTSDFDIALPTHVKGILIVDVSVNGVRKVAKCMAQ